MLALPTVDLNLSFVFLLIVLVFLMRKEEFRTKNLFGFVSFEIFYVVFFFHDHFGQCLGRKVPKGLVTTIYSECVVRIHAKGFMCNISFNPHRDP